MPHAAAAGDGTLCPSQADVADASIERSGLRPVSGRATHFVSPYMTIATQSAVRSRCRIVDTRWCDLGADYSGFGWASLLQPGETALEHVFLARDDGACEYQVRTSIVLRLPYAVWKQAAAWTPSVRAVAMPPPQADQRPPSPAPPATSAAVIPAAKQFAEPDPVVTGATPTGPGPGVKVPLPRSRPQLTANRGHGRSRARRIVRVKPKPPAEVSPVRPPEAPFVRE